ncbi:MAG: DUF1292 domain-containing protein [Bacilli bacterium]|nr:DUF1292 domain-containing protein [Bacilli bacterium]
MTEVGNIVTLEGNEEYLILEETTKNGVRYLYAVRVLIDETPTDEYLIFESIKKDEGEFLLPVSDKELYDQLIEDFKDIVADKILGLEPGIVEEN